MVLLFDVNGTLLDPETLAPHFREIFGSRYTVREWFNEVIQYSMATTLSGGYREFGDLAIAVLQMAADAHDVSLTSRSIASIRAGLKQMAPFPDVKEALGRLREAGFHVAALSNSAHRALEEQIRNAGLSRYFDQILSVDAVRRFKPAIEPYQSAVRSLGIRPRDILMVAAHHWDLMGASRAGLRTAFIARPGNAAFPGARVPDIRARDLSDLADQLAGEPVHRSSTPLGFALVVAGAIAAAALFATGRRRDVPSPTAEFVVR